MCVRAQEIADSLYPKIRKTEIELVYNHYIQDGNNSAVTGGIGTEKLTVYGPSANVTNTRGNNIFNLHLGADIISSASTDNIDYVVSSASSRDARYYTDLNYTRLFKQGLSLSGGLSYSLESDYFSQGYKASLQKTNTIKERIWSIFFQYFNDDLRWGRINPDHYKPVKLIYPSELRYQEWSSTPKRNSFNLKAGFTQAINKRNVLGIFPEITYQSGLLATPFHRVYFSDNSLVVEKLPNKRIKGALALKLNTAVSSRLIVKNSVLGYTDDFGIQSVSFEHESVVKLNPFFSIMPMLRINTQKASEYFAPFQSHNHSEEYYTSDYDLAGFETFLAGFGFKYHPYIFATKRLLFNTMILRYSYMYRNNELSAHIISLVFQTEVFRKKS